MNTSAAFTGGSGLAIPDVATLVAGIGCTVVLLWAAWALLSAYRGWAIGRVRMETFQYAAVRMVLLIVVIFWILL